MHVGLCAQQSSESYFKIGDRNAQKNVNYYSHERMCDALMIVLNSKSSPDAIVRKHSGAAFTLFIALLVFVR